MRMKRLTRFASLVMLTASFSVLAAPATPLPQPIKAYIASISKQYHLNPRELTTLFQAAHVNQDIIDHMNKPYEAKPWTFYRKFFVTPERIAGGVEFWNQHRDILAEAERQYGVPASVIIAILGVETGYGKVTGNYPVLDALTTLSFYYPARADFFKYELTEFLLLTREQKLDPFKLTGSYAGAMGYPQFMPSAYRRFAVDYTNRGSADIIHNPHDAIFSVANFLSKKGWAANQPVADNLNVRRPVAENLLSTSAKPEHTVASLKSQGIPTPRHADPQRPAAIVKLPTDDNERADYWLTYGNFRAIMRYNPHVNYAMAVYQLSEEIHNAYQQNVAARTKTSSARTT